MGNEFEIKDLGNLKYFLPMEVARSKENIFVSQRKYTLDLLNETSMLGCRPADTPIEFNCKLENSDDQVPRSYASTMGIPFIEAVPRVCVGLDPRTVTNEAVWNIISFLRFFLKGLELEDTGRHSINKMTCNENCIPSIGTMEVNQTTLEIWCFLRR
ncbi:putative mitochondrial protein [Cucumis melo var. makuwa]|uniref:Mitochondrial protein n=1 Tax=Cucumis melo var. makuwa TaxID=1194695 RepID=A0A5A7U1W7_CUCMM|nr:putative mitochondrial protein [Cucumis melo var. makuwa]